MNWTLDEALAYYRRQGAPGDQTALTELLREIQREFGAIPGHMPKLIAEFYGIRESLILALIKRIPSLRLSGTHCLELCAGPNCGKCVGLAACAEELQRKHKNFSLKFVPCMRQCAKGPNLRWDGRLYNRATEELLRELVTEAERK